MNQLNRLLICLSISGISITMSACNKGDSKYADPEEAPIDYPDEKPGAIPGFGEAPGQPQGEQFVLPEGVELVETIRGSEDQQTNEDCVYDGPGEYVRVKIKLRRTSMGGAPLRVEFPPGLVIVSTSEGRNQNGLLIEKMLVELPPIQPGGGGSRCDLTLLLLCCNEERDASNKYLTYKFGPVSNSPLVKDIMKRLEGKKINYSEYMPDFNKWILTVNTVQNALYSLTDGKGYKKYNLEEIAKIPNK